jgi:hypothetical protein
MARPMEHVVEHLKVQSFYHSCLRALIHIRVQSGGSIDTSMVSMCLENLDVLNKKGIDSEVIRDTGGVVYIGRFIFTIARFPPDHLL